MGRVHAMGLSVEDVIYPEASSSSLSDKNGGKSLYACTACGKTFKSQEKLDQHSLTAHSDAKPYTCPVCLKSFRLNEYLKRHMLMHARSSKGEYVCEFCGKQFRLSNNLIEHRRIHTGERPYRCDLCGLTFPQNSTLRRHIVVHTNERAHKCDICGKGFARPNQLSIHRRVHTGEKPFECKVCLKKFNQSSQLTRHMSKYHSDELCHQRQLQQMQQQIINCANDYHYSLHNDLSLKIENQLGPVSGVESGVAMGSSASNRVPTAFTNDEISKWGDVYLPHVESLDSPLNAADKFL